MKNSETNKNEFVASIITSIKMNTNDFMENLSKGENYERIIYEWSVNLFNEGKTIEDAIKIIHERRMLIVFNSSYNSSSREEYVSIRNHQRIMEELKSLPAYFNLNQKQKASLQNKIDALIESKLRTHSEVIRLVLEIIKYNFKSKIWSNKKTKKSINKLDPENNELKFLLRFKHYLTPKTALNETFLPSSQLS